MRSSSFFPQSVLFPSVWGLGGGKAGERFLVARSVEDTLL